MICISLPRYNLVGREVGLKTDLGGIKRLTRRSSTHKNRDRELDLLLDIGKTDYPMDVKALTLKKMVIVIK